MIIKPPDIASPQNAHRNMAHEPEVEEVERPVEELTEELQALVEKIQRFLLDKGSFLTTCDEALEKSGGVEDVEKLTVALNYISDEIGIDGIDEDEALDMFMSKLTKPEFYHLAKNYFSSIASVLDLTKEDEHIFKDNLARE